MQIQGLDCVSASTLQLISCSSLALQAIGHKTVHHTQSQSHFDELQQVLAQISVVKIKIKRRLSGFKYIQTRAKLDYHWTKECRSEDPIVWSSYSHSNILCGCI
jgi:hypothetical protein